ncbi:Imm41 family immunity protein [Burkholderia territorii]|uniref:Imm41 family immunity protein n=1 Tax=Burkholderia territorii TaxID=1503055 RepID=UPI0009C0D561|nr:Imm41 family immunity protein [Burkholderia territorii]
MWPIKIDDSRRVIARNWVHSREYDAASFIAILHERSIWQRDQYWLIEWALREISASRDGGDDLNGQIFYIFSYTMNAISSHLDPDDSFEIMNLAKDEVYEFRERIRLVFEGFFLKNFPDQAMFEEENPLIKNGASSSS